MKNKVYAHTTLFGVLDVTKRSVYRAELASFAAELEEVENELKAARSQIAAQDRSLKQAAVDYNSAVENAENLAATLEQVKVQYEAKELELARTSDRINELQGAYNTAKQRLAKWERQRGAGGRFKKKEVSNQ